MPVPSFLAALPALPALPASGLMATARANAARRCRAVSKSLQKALT